ncbi:MAG: ankyrin repeat domain-containing protein [Alphaproteobacteria bacterium]
MTVETRRYVVISPDRKTVSGFDNMPGAEAAAVAFGDGAHIMDTFSGTYEPALQTVEGGEVVLTGHGSFNRKDGFDANLMEAAKRGIVAAVIGFLSRGADANASDDNGGTVLHWAVAHGSLDVVSVLIKVGADPIKTDRRGLSPLALAKKKGLSEIVEKLSA